MKLSENIEVFHGDSLKIMQDIPDKSIHLIVTDPPYKYLKNQKLEVDFDETIFFNECKRVLKDNGFIVLFGRGTSFYRWNTMLADLGFIFKEEIIWDKKHSTSPLMAISRVHETVSIHTPKTGTINKVKVPYLEMKRKDIPAIITDIKRLLSVFSNSKSLKAVSDFLENNVRDTSDSWDANKLTISSNITKENRCVSVARMTKKGMTEKIIIRTDRVDDKFTKFGINSGKRKCGNRCGDIIQSMEFGLNEKTIIKQVRDQYTAIHPTQKPIRLLERLIALVLPKSVDTKDIIILDPFRGSGSTERAAYNLGCKAIAIEIDQEYFDLANEETLKHCKQLNKQQS